MTILDGDSRTFGPWSTEPNRIHIECQDGLDRNLTISPTNESGGAAAAHSQARAETSLGVAVSRFQMPDGRTDSVLSSSHPRWSTRAARRLAALMWPAFELVEARTPGVVHVIVGTPRSG